MMTGHYKLRVSEGNGTHAGGRGGRGGGSSSSALVASNCCLLLLLLMLMPCYCCTYFVAETEAVEDCSAAQKLHLYIFLDNSSSSG